MYIQARMQSAMDFAKAMKRFCGSGNWERAAESLRRSAASRAGEAPTLARIAGEIEAESGKRTCASEGSINAFPSGPGNDYFTAFFSGEEWWICFGVSSVNAGASRSNERERALEILGTALDQLSVIVDDIGVENCTVTLSFGQYSDLDGAARKALADVRIREIDGVLIHDVMLIGSIVDVWDWLVDVLRNIDPEAVED